MVDYFIKIVEQKTGEELSRLQIAVLKGAYENKSYKQIANLNGYGADHIRHVGSDLCELLSNCFGRAVNKKNLKSIIKIAEKDLFFKKQNMPELEIPTGIVEINSRFYIERKEIESLCLKTLSKKGGLVKIKALPKMGKSSLMMRIIRLATNCQHVYLNLELADGDTLSDLNRLLRWFSSSVSRHLKLPSKIDEYWDNDYGSKSSCDDYFEEYLLAKDDRPLILAIDKLDVLFEKPVIANEFLSLLRAWHEKSKIDSKWNKFRLILAYEPNPLSLENNNSPLSVGETISELEFSANSVFNLTNKHGLDWSKAEVELLMNKIGGHPYLVRQALYDIATKKINLNEFLELDLKTKEPYKKCLMFDSTQERLNTFS